MDVGRGAYDEAKRQIADLQASYADKITPAVAASLETSVAAAEVQEKIRAADKMMATGVPEDVKQATTLKQAYAESLGLLAQQTTDNKLKMQLLAQAAVADPTRIGTAFNAIAASGLPSAETTALVAQIALGAKIDVKDLQPEGKYATLISQLDRTAPAVAAQVRAGAFFNKAAEPGTSSLNSAALYQQGITILDMAGLPIPSTVHESYSRALGAAGQADQAYKEIAHAEAARGNEAVAQNFADPLAFQRDMARLNQQALVLQVSDLLATQVPAVAQDIIARSSVGLALTLDRKGVEENQLRLWEAMAHQTLGEDDKAREQLQTVVTNYQSTITTTMPDKQRTDTTVQFSQAERMLAGIEQRKALAEQQTSESAWNGYGVALDDLRSARAALEQQTSKLQAAPQSAAIADQIQQLQRETAVATDSIKMANGLEYAKAVSDETRRQIAIDANNRDKQGTLLGLELTKLASSPDRSTAIATTRDMLGMLQVAEGTTPADAAKAAINSYYEELSTTTAEKGKDLSPTTLAARLQAIDRQRSNIISFVDASQQAAPATSASLADIFKVPANAQNQKVMEQTLGGSTWTKIADDAASRREYALSQKDDLNARLKAASNGALTFDSKMDAGNPAMQGLQKSNPALVEQWQNAKQDLALANLQDTLVASDQKLQTETLSTDQRRAL
jgi:hypothetical protein